jgi:rubrerythrin
VARAHPIAVDSPPGEHFQVLNMPQPLSPTLRHRLQLAHSAERAAAFAYQGHAGSVRDAEVIDALRQIEADEWHHRDCARRLMRTHSVSPNRYFEAKYWLIGKFISASCYLIGWFLPMYFAGRLESGNVNEYFELKRLFHLEGITEYDELMDEMARVERDHEDFFLGQIRDHWMLPMFQAIFRWGPGQRLNALVARSVVEGVEE